MPADMRGEKVPAVTVIVIVEELLVVAVIVLARYDLWTVTSESLAREPARRGAERRTRGLLLRPLRLLPLRCASDGDVC